VKVLPVKIFFAKFRLVPILNQEPLTVRAFQNPESGREIPSGLVEVVADLGDQGVDRWLGDG
jgi:type III secretory pathway component EscU